MARVTQPLQSWSKMSMLPDNSRPFLHPTMFAPNKRWLPKDDVELEILLHNVRMLQVRAQCAVKYEIGFGVPILRLRTRLG